MFWYKFNGFLYLRAENNVRQFFPPRQKAEPRGPPGGGALPDLDKTWDTQNYVSKELKSGRSPNQPCNSVGLGDGVILRKTEQFPSRFSFV